jgi:type IV pilus assembly protein PilA
VSIQSLRRRGDAEEGFTLIELMVVVLIIAILIAIAIPTFLGAQNRARDRGAQSDLRNALTAAKTVATDHAGYFQNADGTALNAATMTATEPSLSFDVIANASQDKIGLDVTTVGTLVGTRVVFEKQSGSTTWFGVSSDSDGRVSYCKGAQGDCDSYNATDFVAKW